MGEKLIVGPINRGLNTDREPFNIDNDSFPTLINAYQWRGRIKRKRGTTFLARLQRYFDSTNYSYTNTIAPNTSYHITFDASGNANLLGPYTNAALDTFSLQANANIIPGTVTITASGGPTVYTDPAMDGTLSPAGTINYGTGQITIAAQAGQTATVVMRYYPDLPVMGLEDLVLNANEFPGNLAFDTVYSYNMVNTAPYPTYDVSFYKNPPSASINGFAYVQKTDVTPVTWNGDDYQQFFTVNYQGALWATNGINVPFDPTRKTMQFAPASTITYNSNTANTINLTITNCPLVVGDWVFFNEWTGANASTLNFQTGFVNAAAGAFASRTVDITLPWATLGAGPYGPGIVQYLTNRSSTTKDNLRWYDGDPTNGDFENPILNGRKGWVNFSPPLSQGDFSIADLPADQYYLVDARAIIAFKDRLLFLGPVVQTSTGTAIYLQDTVIYSQNGTPYYTASFTIPAGSTILSPNFTFHELLVPTNQTATAPSFFEDSTGFGGFVSAGFSQPIISVNVNEDVLIVGFTNRQSRLVYTGNDIVPFNFFIINSEYGTGSTFSTTTFDRGVVSVGSNGIVITSQISSERVDLDIPDQIFQFNLTNNGFERISSQRDFINEWIYFSYPSNQLGVKFPNQTLQYNYRDQSWGLFIETYTTYGVFRKVTGETWSTLTDFTWQEWSENWNAGASTLLQPQVIAGNQQGFVLIRDAETDEDASLEINNISFPSSITGATNTNPVVLTSNNTLTAGQTVAISGVGGMTQLNGNTYTVLSATPTTITINVDGTAFGVYTSGGTATPPLIYSPNHSLNNGDYIVINGVIGTDSTWANGKIFSVNRTSANELNLIPDITNPITAGTYFGGGSMTRMYIPFIQTRQFPVAWEMARKTRLGPQQYLFTKTQNGQITLQIYLSQNSGNPYNFGAIVGNSDDEDVVNSSLVYSTILYTCPESTNLGLTPANTNLIMPTASEQQQIWHRMNTSLIGDTVQIGFTLSDAQMRNSTFDNQFTEFELHSFVLDVQPSQVLA